MLLTERQNDTLAEVINIAFSRTAASLSELTGDRVQLDPPHVAIHPIQRVAQELSSVIDGEIATVHQLFSGSVAGDALLVLNYEGAVLLTDLLAGTQSRHGRLSGSAAEVLAEVGNILLNACLGMFGNLLQVHVTFSVPHIQLASLEALLASITVANADLAYGLVAYTAFRVQGSAVGGYLVIVLGVASLERLIETLDQLE